MSKGRIFFVKSVMQILLYIGGFTTLYYISEFFGFLSRRTHPILEYVGYLVVVVCFFVIGGAIVDYEKIDKQ